MRSTLKEDNRADPDAVPIRVPGTGTDLLKVCSAECYETTNADVVRSPSLDIVRSIL